MALQKSDGIPGSHGDDKFGIPHRRRDFTENLIEYLRLYRQDNHVGRCGSLMVVLRHRNVVGIPDVGKTPGPDIRRDDLRRRKMPAVEQPGDNRLRHISRADKGESPTP